MRGGRLTVPGQRRRRGPEGTGHRADVSSLPPSHILIPLAPEPAPLCKLSVSLGGLGNSLPLVSLAPHSIPFMAPAQIFLRSSPGLSPPSCRMGWFLGSQNTCF